MTEKKLLQYPLLDNEPDALVSASGRPVTDITLQAVTEGQLTVDDARVSAHNLSLQADIAEGEGRRELAANFRRAAELTELSEADILRVYNALRPNRSTKEELEQLVTELEDQWKAPLTAALVQEALQAYAARGCLSA